MQSFLGPLLAKVLDTITPETIADVLMHDRDLCELFDCGGRAGLLLSLLLLCCVVDMLQT